MKKQYEQNDEIEIDLREVFFELLNNWVMILISTILVGVIAFLISRFLLVPKYEATSQLYVLSKSTSITSLADIQMGSNLTNDYMIVVEGRPVLEQVIKNLELEEEYETLKEKVTLENPQNTRILQITVTENEPKKAKVIADEIAKVSSSFIAEKMDQDAPTIIQHGYADHHPVSPNILKNTLIGILLGAFLSIAIIVISYLLNDTIMTSEELEQKLGLHVLGTLPLEELEYNGSNNGKKKKHKDSNKKKA